MKEAYCCGEIILVGTRRAPASKYTQRIRDKNSTREEREAPKAKEDPRHADTVATREMVTS